MGPGGEGEEFVVEEAEPSVYNTTGVEPPVWQPAPQDILLMFEELEKNQVLPLKWACPGRRPPEAEAPEQPTHNMSDGEEDDDEKEEEKRVPEPSAFDFDDSVSEASAKVKITPRTPAQAKRPEKKVACMDNIISSLKRQQKAEREARKSQARNLGMTGFRAGTPSRMAGFSPSTSPRVPGAVSPGPGSPRGSPRVPPPASSPSSFALDGGESATEKKMVAPESPSTVVCAGPAAASATTPGSGDKAPSPSSEGPAPQVSAMDVAPAAPAGSGSPGSAENGVGVKVEKDSSEAQPNPVPMETDSDLSESVTVKQEG